MEISPRRTAPNTVGGSEAPQIEAHKKRIVHAGWARGDVYLIERNPEYEAALALVASGHAEWLEGGRGVRMTGKPFPLSDPDPSGS